MEIIAILVNLKKNDEVIIPAYIIMPLLYLLLPNGAKIIWADINFKSRTIDLEDFKKITKNTKAVIIVHLYGYAVDFRKIINFCKKKI